MLSHTKTAKRHAHWLYQKLKVMDSKTELTQNNQ